MSSSMSVVALSRPSPQRLIHTSIAEEDECDDDDDSTEEDEEDEEEESSCSCHDDSGIGRTTSECSTKTDDSSEQEVDELSRSESEHCSCHQTSNLSESDLPSTDNITLDDSQNVQLHLGGQMKPAQLSPVPASSSHCHSHSPSILTTRRRVPRMGTMLGWKQWKNFLNRNKMSGDNRTAETSQAKANYTEDDDVFRPVEADRRRLRYIHSRLLDPNSEHNNNEALHNNDVQFTVNNAFNRNNCKNINYFMLRGNSPTAGERFDVTRDSSTPSAVYESPWGDLESSVTVIAEQLSRHHCHRGGKENVECGNTNSTPVSQSKFPDGSCHPLTSTPKQSGRNSESAGKRVDEMGSHGSSDSTSNMHLVKEVSNCSGSLFNDFNVNRSAVSKTETITDLKDLYSRYVDVMYTNRDNLEHTIMIQQRLFEQQLSQSKGSYSRCPKIDEDERFYHEISNKNDHTPCSNSSASESVINGDVQGRSSQNHSKSHCDQTNKSSHSPALDSSDCVPMEWVMKRRSDGSKYILHRPVKQQHSHRERKREVTQRKKKKSLPSITSDNENTNVYSLLERQVDCRHKKDTPVGNHVNENGRDCRRYAKLKPASMDNEIKEKSFVYYLDTDKKTLDNSSHKLISMGSKPLLSVTTM